MPPTLVAKSASWYNRPMNDPFYNAKFGIWMGRFFKVFPEFKNIQILEKSGDFTQNLAQNWADWYMNRSSLFLEKLVSV